jgi:hypothetical protein
MRKKFERNFYVCGSKCKYRKGLALFKKPNLPTSPDVKEKRKGARYVSAF